MGAAANSTSSWCPVLPFVFWPALCRSFLGPGLTGGLLPGLDSRGPDFGLEAFLGKAELRSPPPPAGSVALAPFFARQPDSKTNAFLSPAG